MEEIKIDDKELERLLIKNYEYIKTILLGFTKDHEIANDLRGDVVLKAMRFKHKFRHYNGNIDDSFRRWLNTMTRNTYISYYRRLRMEKGILFDSSDYLYVGHTPNYDLGNRVSAVIEEADKKLSKRNAIMFKLKMLQYNDNELSKIFNIELGTVKFTLHSIRKHFKELRDVKEVL